MRRKREREGERKRDRGGGVKESESENEREGRRRVVRSVRVPFISRKLCQTKEIEIVRGK